MKCIVGKFDNFEMPNKIIRFFNVYDNQIPIRDNKNDRNISSSVIIKCTCSHPC